jgi:DNA-binding transcriptional ArsR family regulator
MRQAPETMLGPGCELFMALAGLLDSATADAAGRESTRRALAQARRKLDQGFRRRLGDFTAAEIWLALAAVPGTAALGGEVPDVIDAFASAPPERFARIAARFGLAADPAAAQAAATDALRRFDRTVFAALWRQLRDQLATDADVLAAWLRQTDAAALDRRLGLDADAIGVGSVVFLPSVFAPPGFSITLGEAPDRLVAIPIVVERLPHLPVHRAPSSAPEYGIRRLDPALVFAALGDATRYAIAGLIAQTPMTGAELARRLGTSAPTITYHLRALRKAGLVLERVQGRRVAISLNRAALAGLSEAALAQFFGGDGEAVLRRSRRTAG